MKKVSNKSFTLLELLIVIAVIAILAAIVLVSLSDAQQRAREARGMNFYQNIKSANATNLVGEWRFDNGTGTDTNVVDSSGNKNNGTWNGTGSHWTDGKIKGAGQFNGSNDFVNILDSSSLKSLTKNLTIAFWAYPTNVTKGRQNPLGKAYGGEFDLTMEITGQLSYYHGTAGTNGSPYMWCGCTNMFTNNQWVFVVITRNFNDQKIQYYKNGELQKSSCGSWINPSPSSRSLGIGFEYAGYFQGIIDEVQLYDSALTAKQVKNLYAEGKNRHLVNK